MNDEFIEILIERLGSASAAAAWREFIARYAGLIMHVVRRHESRSARTHDCFVFVCGALSDDGFKRLRAYDPSRGVRFETWLVSVVSNLCVDLRRKQDGRFRPLRAIARLPELEQTVFRHIFVRGTTRAQCLDLMRSKFPDLTEARLAEVNARLFGLLTPQQRFLLGSRLALVNANTSPSQDDSALTLQVADPSEGPLGLTEGSQDIERLHAALARLPADQRLLLRLRFEQELTLAQIARLTRQPDPFRVDRQIRTALTSLKKFMDEGP